MKYRVIDRCREAYPVRMMCRCLKVSASGYYGWRDRPMSPRARENQRLLDRIRVLHVESDGILGAGRICEDLRDEGEQCGLNRVARLMRDDAIQGIPCKKRHPNKPSGERPADIENHLARDFVAEEPNSKSVTDIFYIRIVGGLWLYLCVVIDLHSGIIVGWSMSRCKNKQLILQAVLMASWQRESRQPVVLHSDRGCQLEFKESSQHWFVEPRIVCRRVLRQASSIRVSCEACCCGSEQLHRVLLQSEKAAKAGSTQTGGIELNSTVRGIGVRPMLRMVRKAHNCEHQYLS